MASVIRCVTLGVTVGVRCDDGSVGRAVMRLLDSFETAAPDSTLDVAYSIHRDGSSWLLERADGVKFTFEAQNQVLGRLVHDINRTVIERTPLVALHSGAVVHDRGAVILPGEMEVGKTTLTAGLVRAGCDYLSDEAVGLDSVTHHALPYPKPLSIDAGAQHLFPELASEAVQSSDGAQTQWQVPPDAIRRDAVGASCPVRVVVFPRFEPSATTRLDPLRRAAALVELARATFRFRDRPRQSLDVLAPVVRGATCYRLVTGDLAPAVTAVLGLVDAGQGALRGAR